MIPAPDVDGLTGRRRRAHSGRAGSEVREEGEKAVDTAEYLERGHDPGFVPVREGVGSIHCCMEPHSLSSLFQHRHPRYVPPPHVSHQNHSLAALLLFTPLPRPATWKLKNSQAQKPNSPSRHRNMCSHCSDSTDTDSDTVLARSPHCMTRTTRT